MKVKFANKIFEVLYTKEVAGLTMYAVEDEPNHIDWLVNVEVVNAEKQGEQKSQGKSALEVWREIRLEVYQQASGNRHEPNCSDDSTKMFSLTDLDEIFEKVAEKQGERKHVVVIPKFRVGDVIRPKGSMAEYTIESISGECYHGKGWGLHISCDDDYELVEQKPTDNIESKFKVGDWIEKNDNSPVNEDDSTIKILKAENGNYTVESVHGYRAYSTFDTYEKDYHLWTSQDAKDGDVLTLNGKVFIYAHRKQLYSIAVAHCFVDNAGGFHFDGEFGYTEEGNSIHPATKEQRNLLLEKIVDAGYIWDTEKKVLTKLEDEHVPITEWIEDYWKHHKVTNPDSYNGGEEIQFDHDGFVRFCQTHCQKSAWSENDEQILEIIKSVLRANFNPKERFSGYEEYMNADLINWLSSLEEKYFKPTAWSEEDERILKGIISSIMISRGSCEEDDDVRDMFDNEISWLESIKERMKGE